MCPPPEPVIVSVNVPRVVEPVVAIESVDDVPVVDVGLNVPLAPLGRPPTVNVTAALKPPVRVTETEKLVLRPCLTERLLGEALTLKSTAWTTSVTVVMCVLVPSWPVIVSE